ncbi:unnamed protein product [Rangifer tarandus platyrhynchus]|uniref:Secreted protein n=2 Tax=Rangifer tarandus platyrhynchus TaxID=3082113 RepID=A0ABN8Z9P7_RANTA|nr:unnamed protein product [Rangifer tarandus platyrhynchus]
MLFLVYKLAKLQFVFLVLFSNFCFFDICTVFLIGPLYSGQVCCNISYQLPCCVHQQRGHISIVIVPIPASHPGPISFLPLTRCFKGSDFQHIKLMQNKCVAFTTESFLWKPSLLRDGENLNV